MVFNEDTRKTHVAKNRIVSLMDNLNLK